MNLSLVTLGDPRSLSGGYLYHRRMAAAAPAHDAHIRFVSFPDRAFPLPALEGGRVLASAGDADAVLLDSIAAAFGAPWLGRVRVPVIGILHQPPGGIDHPWPRRALQARLDRRAYGRAGALIVASDALVDELRGLGVDHPRTVVVAPGRDAAVGPPAGDLRRGRRCALLCVANWLPRKGILELLEAVAGLSPDAATLHLVGDTTGDRRYERRVRTRLAAADLKDRVVVHGPVGRDVVSSMYEAADVFVLASTREPYGTAYAEAMATGLPIVAWRVGNAIHLARDGREGLLVEPGDVGALTQALGRLIDDVGLRTKMSAAAALRAASFPTWEESAARFFTTIRELVGT